MYMLNSMVDINICTIHPHIQSKQKDLLYLAIFFRVGRIFSRGNDFQDHCLRII